MHMQLQLLLNCHLATLKSFKTLSKIKTKYGYDKNKAMYKQRNYYICQSVKILQSLKLLKSISKSCQSIWEQKHTNPFHNQVWIQRHNLYTKNLIPNKEK